MSLIEPQRLKALRKRVIIRFGLAAVLIPAILFAMAGTLNYWQGWLYWMVLIIPMLFAVSYLLRADPELLERRMKSHEREHEQQIIVRLGSAVWVAGFMVIALDLRLQGLNQVPAFIALAADAGVFLGYCLVLWVFRENTYASRTVEVVEGQKVITTGAYSIVRHPMYLGSIIMILFTPIALGSWWAVPVFSLYIPVLIWRIFNEERVLLRDLPGYREYCMKRPYRLVPYVW
ncbi:MAG: Isoprenylcysteine carboxyl methyltransferase (ICMT) family protein [Methanosaeta sp. PtaU1.Bin060]|nr:MAG: Isoprenylcysteine carboxyl methyltransferase (ICMT) family protein [Methanosaeta sp. PtaU1.Bin060]